MISFLRHSPWAILIICLILVTFRGLLPRWHFTLSGDFQRVYYPLAKYFAINHNLSHYQGILTYPPGANLFFILIPSTTIQVYEFFLVLINCLLVLILAKVTNHPIMLSLLILASGPIILFRFDVLVLVFLVCSIIAFRQKHFVQSGICLGLATVIKLFPLVLVPYFLLLLRFRKPSHIFAWLFSFLLTIIGVFVCYLWGTSQNWYPTLLKLNVSYNVSVHIESVVATVLTLVTAVTNPGPHGVLFQNDFWTLSPLYFLGHARIFKLFSPLVLGLIYLWVVVTHKQEKRFDVSAALLLTLSLIVSSQLFSPQYVLWPALLFSLLDPSDLQTKFWRSNLVIMTIILICTQLVYPLNYGGLINFYSLGTDVPIFLILVLRNFALIILTARLLLYGPQRANMPLLSPR